MSYLPLTGGTMQGAINMNGNRIKNVPNPANDGDAVNYRALNNAIDAAIEDVQPVAWTIVLDADNWVNNQQTVEDERFLVGDYCYFISAAPSDSNTYGWCGITAEDITVNGEIVFNCSVAPSEDITVYIRRAAAQ